MKKRIENERECVKMKEIFQLVGAIIGFIIGFKILGIIRRNIVIIDSCQNLMFYIIMTIIISTAFFSGIFEGVYTNLFNRSELVTKEKAKENNLNNRLDKLSEEDSVKVIGGKSDRREKIVLSDVMTSSNLEVKNEMPYLGENMIDGDRKTAWVEGVNGNGIGEFININFNGNFKIDELQIINGYSKNEDIYYKNNRLKKIKVVFSNHEFEVNLKDVALINQRIEFKDEEIISSFIYIEILEVYEGHKYDDTCISEIQVFGSVRD